MTCDNCPTEISYHGLTAGTEAYCTIADVEDATYQGDEDAPYDTLTLCYACYNAVMDRRWEELGARREGSA